MNVAVESSKQRIKELVGVTNYSKIENILDGLVQTGYREGTKCKYETEDTSFEALYKAGVPFITIVKRYQYSASELNELEAELVAKGVPKRHRLTWTTLEPNDKRNLIVNSSFDELVELYDITLKAYRNACLYHKVGVKASCIGTSRGNSIRKRKESDVE